MTLVFFEIEGKYNVKNIYNSLYQLYKFLRFHLLSIIFVGISNCLKNNQMEAILIAQNVI